MIDILYGIKCGQKILSFFHNNSRVRQTDRRTDVSRAAGYNTALHRCSAVKNWNHAALNEYVTNEAAQNWDE